MSRKAFMREIASALAYALERFAFFHHLLESFLRSIASSALNSFFQFPFFHWEHAAIAFKRRACLRVHILFHPRLKLLCGIDII